MISIVVPTYKEAGNLANLAKQLHEVLADVEYELLIADDNSPDDTCEICSSLAAEFPLRLIQSKDRPRDLSMSVIDGIEAANGDRVLVMDADLSHPPQMIPSMLQRLDEHPDAFIIGSRYVNQGGFDSDWSLWRFLNSHIATMMARPLIDCSDPMSGFFMFTRNRVDENSLKPIGYKIGLEIMVRSEFASITELPIKFKDREMGSSKMNLDQQFKYLRHLRRLYGYRFGSLRGLLHLLTSCAGGLVVDIVFYFVLQLLGCPHLVARAISLWPATGWSWFFSRSSVGQSTRYLETRHGIAAIHLANFAINFGLYALLTTSVTFFMDHRVVALMVGAACASMISFAALTVFVYSDKRQ